jgi:hypothetical protein
MLCGVQPAAAQHFDPCTPEGVIEQFAIWTGTGDMTEADIAEWVDLYEASECPEPIKAGARAVAEAFLSMQADSSGAGTVTYTLPGGGVYRIEARVGAAAEDVSEALDALAPRAGDEWLNVSPDGAWLLLSTDRFDPDCAGWACLALVSADLSAAEVLRVGGAVIHGGFGVAAPGGDLVVYESGEGAHSLDLAAVVRGGDGWTAPVFLTAESPYAWNSQPAISADGARLVFNCGDEPYAAEDTAICEVAADGTGFRVVLSPDRMPSDVANALNRPAYAPDGSIVFESDWGGTERIWRLSPGQDEPYLVTDVFTNDNSPCVLPDGRIVSLWLNREGGQGYHELKVMSADGSDYDMLVVDIDLLDGVMGCGR